MSRESIKQLESYIAHVRAEGRISPAEAINAQVTLEVAKALLEIAEQVEAVEAKLS